MKIIGSMKRQKAFENFIMNCRMIVLIKLYTSKILVKQKSVKLMTKNLPSLRLLLGCR